MSRRPKIRFNREQEVAVIRKAQAGDSQALADIVESQMDLAWLQARRWATLPSLDFDDCLSAAQEALLVCVRKFDERHERRLSTFVTECIHFAMLGLLTKLKCKKRRMSKSGQSPAVFASIVDHRTQSAESIAHRNELKQIVDAELAKLGDRDRDIIRRRLQDETYESIARSYERTGGAMLMAHNRALRKLEEPLWHVA